MGPVGTTIITVILSAIVGSATAMIVEKTKLKYRLLVENEYVILTRIWKRAYWLKSRAGNLRPKLDSYPPTETEQQRRDRRLLLFEKAMNKFEEEMYFNKPFYPREIYPILRELRAVAGSEAIDYAHMSSNTTGYFEDSKKNTDKINELVDQLCDAIRSRLHNEIEI